VPGRSIAIAANRDGRAAAEIDLADGDSPRVAVLERSPTRSRIAWRLDDGVLVGWVAAADLARPWGGAGGHMVRAPRMHQGRTTLPPPSAITCPGPIPLAAERDGERRAIGTIEPHTIFVLGPSHTGPRAGPHDGYEAVTFLDTPLEPTEGTTLLVPSVELGECGPLRK